MYETNAYKVTMLFPKLSNDGTPFQASVWSWWLDEIVRIGLYHEFAAEGTWLNQPESHRCIVMIVDQDKLPALEAFLREARVRFGQDVMYFEVHPVYFKLI